MNDDESALAETLGEFLNDFDQRRGAWRVLVLYLGFFLYLLGLRSFGFLGWLGDLGESSLSRNIGYVCGIVDRV